MNRFFPNVISSGKKWINRQKGKNRGTKALRQVEAARGKTRPALIKQSGEYAHDVLGWGGFAPWLCVYSAIRGQFVEGWIPSNFYSTRVVPHIKGRHGRLSDMKTLSRQLFGDALPDIGYVINGVLLDRDHRPVDHATLKAGMFADSGRIVFKRDQSNKGAGVRLLDPAEYDAMRFDKDGVFQRFIRQHEFFDDIVPGSVATLRLTTVCIPDGSIELRAAYLRTGRVGEAAVQSASHIRVSLDVHDGRLSPVAFLPDWREAALHPDTGFEFGGHAVPGFDRCVELVRSLHARMPHIGCIGWDVGLDGAEQPWIMEWNGYVNDIKFSEAASGPCFLGLDWERYARAK